MKGIDNELDGLIRIQQELDSMAAETPEMPEEFRRAWRKAIREEAANRTGIRKKPAQAEREEAVPVTDILQEIIGETEQFAAPDRFTANLDRYQNFSAETEEQEPSRKEFIPAESADRIVPLPERENADVPVMQHAEPVREGSVLRTRRWTGILSAAAAMIFLIGGTLATRNTLSPRLRIDPAAAKQEAAVNRTGKASVQATALPTVTMEPVLEETEEAAFEAAEEADGIYSAADADMDYGMLEAAGAFSGSGSPKTEEKARGFSFPGSAEIPAEEAAAASVPSSEKSPAVSDVTMKKSAGTPDAVSDKSADASEPMPEEPEAFAEAEEMEAEEVEAASVPETVKQGKANTSPKGSTRATEEASVPDDAFKGFLREVRYFLEDMGAFLKAALPYLAAGVVLLLAITIPLRNRGKKT